MITLDRLNLHYKHRSPAFNVLELLCAKFTRKVLPYELATAVQVLFEQTGGFRRGFETIYYGQSMPNNSVYPCASGIFGAGCNMAFRREVVLQLGGFDEALDTRAPLPGGLSASV